MSCLLFLAGCVERGSPPDSPSTGLPVPKGYEAVPGASEKIASVKRQKELNGAVESGDLAEVERLLEDSPQLLREKSSTGFSPLLLAAFHGHPDLVKLLLQRGASIEEVDPMGNDAFLLAASGGSVEVLELLQEHGAQLSVRNHTGQTPLHQAALSGRSEAVSYLLAQGMDPNAVDESGATPLHWAAAKNHLGCAEILLAAGADSTVVSHSQNLRPVDHARLHGHQAMVDLLENSTKDR